MNAHTIQAGIYLVIDPSMDSSEMLGKLKRLVKYPLAAVQLWDNFSACEDVNLLISEVVELCHRAGIPVLINNHWEWLNNSQLDGVHLDSVPQNFDEIKNSLDRDFLTGITCNNEMSVIKWADENDLDYISFCSVFPSSTANSCELVSFETIKKTREYTDLPIFLAGGIRPDNISQLHELPYSGIAVVSGIMSADDPEQAIKNYLEKIQSKENAT